LTASSRLISNNRGRIGKNLYTRKGKGGRIMFYRANSDRSEARFIAEEIQKLVYEDGFGYPDIAVFYRMNAQSRVFESVFSRMHIPFTVVGGPRFYEREEVKDILAYVKLAMNPMDEISFARIAAKPPRGIGELTVGAVIDSTVVRGKPVFELGGDSGIPALRLARVRELLDLVAELSGMVEHTPPQRLLKLLFDASGYTEWLQNRGEEERIRNLEELYNAVDEFSREHPGVPISVFVEEVSLNQGGVETGAGHGGVFLITLHNAKGLEFPVVFIAGMEEGIFPHYLSGDSVPDLQEERRLCYVGMTRAMERLYLTAAKVRKLYGRNIERGISKFLMEIPEELVDYREESSLLTAGWPAERGSSFSGPVASRRKAAGSAPGSAAGPGFKERVVPELKLNDRVRHEQYGSGRVVKIDDGIVSIHFDDGKKMMFLLKYTPLRKEAEASETGHGF
jgi:DNA helicase-2/ATP-dependent DNA helicase PcrA